MWYGQPEKVRGARTEKPDYWDKGRKDGKYGDAHPSGHPHPEAILATGRAARLAWEAACRASAPENREKRHHRPQSQKPAMCCVGHRTRFGCPWCNLP